MRRTEELIDPNALPPSGLDCEDGLKGEILRVVHVAHLCTQEHPSLRPSASLALRMLLGEEGPLPAPTRPPFVDDDIVGSSNVINYEDTPQRDACANSSLSSSSAAVVSYGSLLPR
uniref:Cysteine-rich receptor-like protein kinase 2 n=1 Tax=Anthurium amnicola TaxID=1678845 RepID=A0A1D1XN64_9ARAE